MRPEQFDKLSEQLSKRARTLLKHIMEHGSMTTEELQELGYEHPPRAARDLREAGVPLKTKMVIGDNGRRMASYSLDLRKGVEFHKSGGRRTFSKNFRDTLIRLHNNRCAICGEEYANRYFQIDHRVPYEVAGDEVGTEMQHHLFMPLCATCNRQKSWSCEHCINWLEHKDKQVCKQCYWGSPNN